MNLILFGPPGAGKGTQADKIAANFNLHKISTGDLLRNEIEKKTEIGKKIENKVRDGNFVSDEIINNLIELVLSDKNFFNKLIFDGYPRTISQAENLQALLKKYSQKISCVLSLEVSLENIKKRILGRKVCTKCGLIFNDLFNSPNQDNHICGSNFLVKRSDDTEETIKKRYETYMSETYPVLNFYKNSQCLYKIDGEKNISEISKQIQQIITSLKG